LLASCSGELWTIELKDGRELHRHQHTAIPTQTGYYQYENQHGRDALVQAEEVILITKER